jgi:ribosome maturation protein SDO1
MTAQQQQTYTREKIALNLAKLKKGGESFEVILKDVDLALEIRAGKDVDVRDAMNGDLIFHNASKGDQAKEGNMKQWLGTENHLEAAKIIIQKGDIQLTSEQRKRMLEEKRKKIISYIHTNACDPKTKLPLPLQRIELAMTEAKISIDPADKIDYQIEKIIPKLQPILAMSFEKVNIRIIVSAKYAGTAYSRIKGHYNINDEKWRTDGSIQIDIEIVAGMKSDLYSVLNKITSGEVQIEELTK